MTNSLSLYDRGFSLLDDRSYDLLTSSIRKRGDLKKTYNLGDFLKKTPNKSRITPKIDGWAVILFFKDGKCIKAETRYNAMDIPLDLISDECKSYQGEYLIGELTIPTNQLGLKENARSYISSLVNSKNPTNFKHLRVIAYQRDGFYDYPYIVDNLGFTFDSSLIEDSEDLRNLVKCEYQIDGVVNSQGLAFKFSSPVYTTKVINKQLSFGRVKFDLEPIETDVGIQKQLTLYSTSNIPINGITRISFILQGSNRPKVVDVFYD